MKSDLVAVAPPAGVATLTLAGVPLSQWVLIMTLIYTVILCLKNLPGALVVIVRACRWLKERYEQSK